MLRGVTHAEFLKSHADGNLYFIEIAARVGGAYISDVVEAATGINLWREWARLEVGAGKTPYQLPPERSDYAGVIVSLARQEHPDTSAYNDPEIVYRVKKYHHAGFFVKSPIPSASSNCLNLCPSVCQGFSCHATRAGQAQLRSATASGNTPCNIRIFQSSEHVAAFTVPKVLGSRRYSPSTVLQGSYFLAQDCYTLFAVLLHRD